MKARPARTLLAQRLLALSFAGWVLLDFPLLKLVLGGDGSVGPATLLGLPRLPLLLFAAWALLIVLLAWLMERGGGELDEPGDEASDDPGNEAGPGLTGRH